MIEWYPEIRLLHIVAALTSGGLFVLRGLAMWAGSSLGMTAAVRYLSYSIDTVLFGAAVTLAAMLHRVPLADRWITVKIALVLAYIVLGSLALKRAPTLRGRRIGLVAAVAVFLLIYGVARSRGAAIWAAG